MAGRKQNWYKRYKKSMGPGLYFDVDNPTEGVGGKDTFRLFSTTSKGEKFTLGMKGDGKVQMNADVSIEMVAGAKNNPKGTDILIHSRNGSIDIQVNKNGDVRIKGDNIRLTAADEIKMKARKIRMEADDEISLQAPKIWSRGKKGNLVPKTFMQQITAGSFIGPGSLAGFLEKGLSEAAGIVDGLDDLAPGFQQLAGGAGLAGITDQLPGMASQLSGLTSQLPTGQLSGLTGQLSSFAETAGPQLQSLSGSITPQLQSFAQGPGAALGGNIQSFGQQLQSNEAFVNLGKGLIPSGY